MNRITYLILAAILITPVLASAARTRSAPAPQPTITTDKVMAFGVVLAYDAAGNIDTDNIVFQYIINNEDANGAVVKSVREVVKFPDWPAAVKTDLKAVYNKVLVDAETKGLIGAGTDTDDLP